MGSAVVVFFGEFIQEELKLLEGFWLVGFGAQPFLQGLLEPLHFALGGGVVGAAIFLGDVEFSQFCFESVAAACAASAGESCGENPSVVSQC